MSRGERTEANARAGHRPADSAQEIALIGQVASGDMTAFETLFRRYYPRLRRFIEQKTRRPQLVDEILNLGERATVPYLPHTIHDVQNRLGT